MTMFAALRPHDPKNGYPLKRMTVRSVMFEALPDPANPTKRQWHRVDDDFGRELSMKRVNESPNSALAFDVVDERMARQMEEDVASGRTTHEQIHNFLAHPTTLREREAIAKELSSGRGGDLSTADLAAAGGLLGFPGIRSARTGRSSFDTNPDDAQNHWRPGGSTATDRGPRETHATDPNPPAPGQSPDLAKSLGTPSNPIDNTSGPTGAPPAGDTSATTVDKKSATAKK